MTLQRNKASSNKSLLCAGFLSLSNKLERAGVRFFLFLHTLAAKPNQLRSFLTIAILLLYLCSTAQTKIPSYYKQSKKFTDSLKAIVHDVGLDSTYNAGEDGQEQISFAVIDLSGKKPV